MKAASVRPHRTAPVKCPVCERSVERRSRQQRYCSRRCMKAANYARKAGSGELLGHDTALGPNPHKSANKINELQRPKIGSSLFYNGPLNLLGGGSFRWPEAGHLDGKTLTKIRHSEVGGELLVVGDPCEGSAS